MVSTNSVYNTISNILFIAPLNPGSYLVGTASSTATQITEANRIHKEDTHIWREYQVADNSLKQLLLGAVGNMYTSTALKNSITGYTNITTCQLTVHLYNVYGNITTGNLEANEQKMKAPFDLNQPIDDGQQFLVQTQTEVNTLENPYKLSNTIDSIITQALLYGQKACHLPPKPPWSKALHQASCRGSFWKTIQNFKLIKQVLKQQAFLPLNKVEIETHTETKSKPSILECYLIEQFLIATSNISCRLVERHGQSHPSNTWDQ